MSYERALYIFARTSVIQLEEKYLIISAQTLYQHSNFIIVGRIVFDKRRIYKKDDGISQNPLKTKYFKPFVKNKDDFQTSDRKSASGLG